MIYLVMKVVSKFEKVLKEYKNKKLKSNGKTVKKRKQALAIAFSEERKALTGKNNKFKYRKGVVKV